MTSILSEADGRAQEYSTSWDTTGADLILRSEVDGVDLRVHKLMLVHGFQCFEDMLSGTPLLGSAGDMQEIEDGLPVVTMPESSTVLQKLLALIYPIDPPGLDPQPLLLELCVALDKYCVKSYPRPVVDRLMYWVRREPEMTYICACRFRLPEVAEAALSASLRSPKLFTEVQPTELKNISAEQYHAFVMYQIHSREKALSVVEDVPWMRRLRPVPPGFVLNKEVGQSAPRCITCYNSSSVLVSSGAATGPSDLRFPSNSARLSTWLSHYLDAVRNALANRTTGAVATDQTCIQDIFKSPGTVICESCKTADNALAMMTFANQLKKEIDRRIKMVERSIPGLD